MNLRSLNIIGIIIFLTSIILACPPQPPLKMASDGTATIGVGQTLTLDGSGKYYCPDSGQIVEYQWILPSQAYSIQGDHTSTLKSKFSPAGGPYEVELQVRCNHDLWNTDHVNYPTENRYIVEVTVTDYSGPWHASVDGEDNNDGRTWTTAFRTIQTAIDSASDGDEIRVACGSLMEPAIYYEQLDMKGKSLYIHSEDSYEGDGTLEGWQLVENTILDAQKEGTAVVFRGNETQPFAGEANIEGITITGGFPAGDGLALHLKFDEMSGDTAADSSGKQRHGTLINDPNWMPNGYTGGALEFDGIDDYVEIENYKGISGSASRTCGAWIKTTTANKELISWGANSDSGKWLVLLDTEGRLRVAVNGGNIVGTSILTDGCWHHIAAVLNDDGSPDVSEVQLYVDGFPETISSFLDQPVCTDSEQDVQIGLCEFQGSYRYFEGLMDDVRIYSRALGETEIKNLAGLQNPIAHWKMDEGSGETEIVDVSDNHYNGTIFGATTGVTGYLKNAINFDGNDDYVAIANFTGINDDSSHTCSAWVNLGLTGYGPIIEWGNWGYPMPGRLWQVGINDSGKLYVRIDPSVSKVGQTVINDGKWHHIAVVLENDGTPDISEVKFFVDGQEDYTGGSGTIAANAYDTNVRLGAGFTGFWETAYYSGLLDDVRIYQRALSADEIGILADNHPNLIAHLKFESEDANRYVGDSSGNDNHAKAHGALGAGVTFGPGGVFGNCASFDGVGDYSGDDDCSFMDFYGSGTYNQYSVSLWFNTTETGNAGILLQDAHTAVAESHGRPQIGVNSNKSYIIGGDPIGYGTYGTSLSSALGMADGNWHYLVGTVDSVSKEIELFVDGRYYGSYDNDGLVFPLDLSNSGNYYNRVEIGARTIKNSYYTGKIDELKIYNKVLNSAEVAMLYSYETSEVNQAFIAHYKLDDDCTDSSGNEHHGSLEGCATSQPGVVGTAMQFDGAVGNYVQLDPLFDPGKDAFSAFVWVRLDTKNGSSYQTILAQENLDGNGRPLLSRKAEGDVLFCYLGGVETVSQTAVFANPGQWHQVGLTYDGKYVSLYVDGKKEATELRWGELTNGGLRLAQQKDGIDYGVQAPWNGALDDVRIYNYALSDAEAIALYDTGGGIKGYGASVSITKCIIEGNLSESNGAGIAGVDGAITNCFIISNESNTDGGGLANCDGTIINCVIAENTAVNAGAFFGDASSSSGTVINCTIVNNAADPTSGTVGGVKGYDGAIANTVFWGNTDSGATTIDAQIESGTTATYSCIQSHTGVYSGSGNIDDDPSFIDTNLGDGIDYDGTDDILGTLDDGLNLQETSDSKDVGNNTIVDNIGIDKDIVGFDREIDGDHDGTITVDMGAYEGRTIIYVDGSVAASGTGTSWASPYKYLKDALTAAVSGGYEIWVKGLSAGLAHRPDQDVSNPTGTQSSSATFTIPSNVKVLGGFSGNGVERDASTYLTILTGDMSGVYCSYVVTFGLDTTNIDFDGFRIEGGERGISCQANSDPVVSNCKIQNNRRAGIWSSGDLVMYECSISNNTTVGDTWNYGVVCSSSEIIKNCIISGNKYGIRFHWSEDNPIVENSTIENNTYCGIYVAGSSGRIDNCTIKGNGTQGGVVNSGIYIETANANPLIIDCLITNNYQRGIYGYNRSSATIQNCLIIKNRSDNSISHGISLTQYVEDYDIINCTIADNWSSTSTQSYGVYVESVYATEGDVNIENSIIWGQEQDIRVLPAAENKVTVSCSCFNRGATGTGVINSNPRFIDPPEYPTDEVYDYHLSYGSQCINAGSDGNNMGAYGNTGTATQFIDDDSYGLADGISDTWQEQYWSGFDPSVTPPAVPPADPMDSWDPEVDSDGDGLSNIDEFYLGWNPTANDTEGGTGQIQTLVTNLDQGTTGIKYPSIADAIDFASSGDELEAAQTTYNEVVNFKGKAIHLRSENPLNPTVVANTIIDGQNTQECVVIFNTSEGIDSILDGFTIQNGGCNVFCDDGVYPTIQNCVIQIADASIPQPMLGTSVGMGAGVFCKDRIMLNNCKIRNNEGVGICFYKYGIDPQVTGCEITGNGSESGLNAARGIYAYTDWGTSNVIHVSNSLIADNSKASGAVYGIDMSSSDIEIDRCTIVNNYPEDEPGSGNGIHGHGHNSDITIMNSIIWANGDDFASSGINDYSYCCIEDMDEGEGVIHSNPLFNNPVNGDYSLYYASACIDAGDPDDTGWQNEPTGNGGRINMGAYGGTSEATVFIDTDTDGMSDDWETEFFGDLTHGPTTDEDASVIDGLRNIDEFYNASDPTVNDSASRTDTIETLVFNGRLDDGNGVYYPSIMRAIDLAEHNDTLVAEEAIYDEEVNFKGKAIHLKSTDPTDSSVVEATVIGSLEIPVELELKRVIFETGESNTSLLDGFTVQDGGYGVYCTNASPTIQNCIMQENKFISGKSGSGSGIYVAYNGEPDITNCMIQSNEYYGLNIYTNGVVIADDCEIANNGEAGVNGSGNTSISNSNISNNGRFGISLSGGTSDIYNCLIASNNANSSGGSYGINTTGGIFDISSCTIVDNIDSSSYGIIASGIKTTISNSIIWGNGHSIAYLTGPNDSITYSCIEDGFAGTGNITDDPLFIDSANGDYHLKSEEGRWDPIQKIFVDTDIETSPCIDAGQPWAEFSNEPSGENGGRVNMGTYGNTQYASKSTVGLDMIPDQWQATYWPDTFNPADPDTDEDWSPGEDYDGDGFSNEAEYLYGYDPTSTTTVSLQIVHWEQIAPQTDPMSFDPTQAETIVTKFWINKDIETSASIEFENVNTETATVSFTGQWNAGENQLVWDGTDTTQAEIVLKEDYISTLMVENGVEDVSQQFNTITLTYPHEVTKVMCGPSRIIPAFNEYTNIFYEATVTADMLIEVYKPDDDPDDHGITPFAAFSVMAGDTNVPWDGRSDGGYYPSIEGIYKVKVQLDGMRENAKQNILIGR